MFALTWVSGSMIQRVIERSPCSPGIRIVLQESCSAQMERRLPVGVGTGQFFCGKSLINPPNLYLAGWVERQRNPTPIGNNPMDDPPVAPLGLRWFIGTLVPDLWRPDEKPVGRDSYLDTHL